MSRSAGVLSFVEHGWRGARECAIAVTAHGIPVTHLIRGQVPPQVLAMIRPLPGERLLTSPRTLYSLGRWWLLCAAAASRRAGWLLVDNERTLGAIAWWSRRCGWKMVLVQEIDNRCVYQEDGRAQTLAEIFELT